MSQGENFTVKYAPGYSSNMVGGGRVRVSGNGENVQIQHRDEQFAMQAPGIPVFTGGSEGSIAYLPLTARSTLLANR